MARPLLALLLLLPLAARAADFADATGRSVAVPDAVARVLPAGPPAAVLLAALAPDLMLGWPGQAPPRGAEFLPQAVASLPAVPRLTGRADATEQVAALKPDLILDYGDTGPRYAALAADTQRRTGVPTLLLDGALPRTPDALRLLGHALHREARAEELAQLAERLLAEAPGGAPQSVVYARGADGLDVAAPGSGAAAVFALLGWRVLAPAGEGAFRHATMEQVAALDPDRLVFADAGMRATVAGSPEWRALRAVRTGQASVMPATPFGWAEEPPSINRLLGLALLRQPGTAAAAQATLFGRALDPAAVEAMLRPIGP